MQAIAKSFPGVRALDGADLSLWPGEVHALMGENGAGKSTLMKVLGGVHQPDAGTMLLRGAPYQPRKPHDAAAAGIGFIHQELNLALNMTVAENVMMGRLPTRGPLLDHAALALQARAALERLEIDLPLDRRVGELTVGHQQMVEIARAVSTDADILIMDEPTAALSHAESEHLFALMRRLREAGKSIVYISHRMDEVYALADRMTIMRDGRTVGSGPISEFPLASCIRAMVGRDLAEQFPPRQHEPGAVRFAVRGLCRGEAVRDVSFAVRQGEIVGFAGLVGAGRTEIARAIIGADACDGGTLELDSQPLVIRSPRDAHRHGIGYITEDRKGQGLVLPMSISENITLASLRDLSRAGVLHHASMRDMVSRHMQDLRIRASGPAQRVQTLSGGNQQKVVMARWLARDCKVLIFDEPTRGVDVGAKAEIYRIIEDLSRQGVAIMLISSELPELIGLADRILVVHRGRISGEFRRADGFDAEAIMARAFLGAAQQGSPDAGPADGAGLASGAVGA